MNLLRKFAAPALLWLGVLWAGTAQAALIVSGSFDGGAAVFAVDNQVINTCGAVAVGCQLPDLDPAVGTLTLGPTSAGTGGGLNIQGTVQTSDKATVPGTINRLDSTGTQVTAVVGTHTYIVAVSDTGFVGPVVQATTTGAGQFSNLGAGYGATDILMDWFNDPTNQQGAESPTDTPGLLLDTFAFNPTGSPNPVSFSHTGGPFAVNDPSLFSMTLQFSGTLAEGVRLTGREMTEIKPLVAVSAPGSAWLLGIGALLLAGGVVRQKAWR
jgi:hypothetical protein